MKNTNIIVVAAMTLWGLAARAQETPIHWSYSAEKRSDRSYVLHFIATMDKGWHIYAQLQPKEAVATPTQISFDKNPLLSMEGRPIEIGEKKKYEGHIIHIVQYQYEDRVEFVARVTLKAKVKMNVTGNITFQVCTDERCLPPETRAFSVALP